MPELYFVLVRHDFPVRKPNCGVRHFGLVDLCSNRHFAYCGVDLVPDTDRGIGLAELVSVGRNSLGKGC
jgi:hypothetical protein